MIRTSLVVAASVLVAQGALAQQGRDDATWTWSKQLQAGSRLAIVNPDGPISVREASGNAVEVRATKTARRGSSIRDVAFAVEETANGVRICTLYGDQRSCREDRMSDRDIHVRVAYEIAIPRSLRLDATTGNGDVTIERAGAEVHAVTGNGRVSVGQTSGRVDVSTGNGDVTIESANGPVTANSGNGRITVNTSAGPVSANTGNGDIDVRMKSLAAAQGMSFNSGSGSITVTLPGDFNGRIDAMTGSGSLRSDFEISIVGRMDPQHIRGTIGKGGPLLRFTTGSGNIELRKN
ncbi:MAG TPA: DUF4097 family beta strand repeat-containing protein [Gemmatimonadaceae bacterium]|nr:DUF4097 family beta strand repeat-containing protein [Gemmatimonadaceae bacterium]